MEFLIILAGIAVCVGLIMLAIAIAREFQRIAEMKGHGEKRWFWWCLLLPPVGFPMVIALPDRGGKEAAAPAFADELPDL